MRKGRGTVRREKKGERKTGCEEKIVEKERNRFVGEKYLRKGKIRRGGKKLLRSAISLSFVLD